jgi:membrane protein YdbS with pleckstrin-like domain
MKKYLITISTILAGIIIVIMSSVFIVKAVQSNVRYKVVFDYGDYTEEVNIKKGSLVKEQIGRAHV